MANKKNIQKELDKSLGPEFLSTRQGVNNAKLTYLEGHTAISIANKLFGYDGWSSKILKLNQTYMDTNKEGKISVGYTCKCRIKLKDGTTKEDVGFGSTENSYKKGLAIEKASKEAVTDAIKRCLRQFGNVLGNCCYDKNYLNNIKNVRKVPDKFNPQNLLRKSDVQDTTYSKEDSMDNIDFTTPME